MVSSSVWACAALACGFSIGEDGEIVIFAGCALFLGGHEWSPELDVGGEVQLAAVRA